MDNITPCAQHTLALARRVASAHKLEQVDIDHLLLGMLRLNKGLAVQILQAAGIDTNALKAELDGAITDGTASLEAINLPYSSSLKIGLALGVREAQRIGNTYFGTDHLLLGLLRRGEGPACEALRSQGLALGAARKLALKLQAEDPNRSSESCVALQ